MVYSLDEILLLVLSGVLSGADDFVEIAAWGRMRLSFLRCFLAFAEGVPSHDTLNDVFNAVDGDQFQACFCAWVDSLRKVDDELIAIDGKTSRRSGDRRKGRDPLHLVSAWASKQRLVLG